MLACVVAIGPSDVVAGPAADVIDELIGAFDIAVGLLFAAGGLVLFVKDGVFAWDGLVTFWAVVAAFGAWVAVTFVGLRRAIDQPGT